MLGNRELVNAVWLSVKAPVIAIAVLIPLLIDFPATLPIAEPASLTVGHSTRLQFTTLVATGQEFLDVPRMGSAERLHKARPGRSGFETSQLLQTELHGAHAQRSQVFGIGIRRGLQGGAGVHRKSWLCYRLRVKPQTGSRPMPQQRGQCCVFQRNLPGPP